LNDKLSKEQVDDLLEELKDPIKAKQFLMNAGLIDQYGQLTKPYQQIQQGE
jgi:hypothetical protein